MRDVLTVVLCMLGLCVFRIYTEKCKEEANGRFRLKCDADKTYAAVQCNKTHCFCVGKDGIQIENYHSPITSVNDMDCKCARDKNEYQVKTLIGRQFRCAPNGSYKSIQCLGSICYCVDRNGKKTDSKTFVPIGKLNELHCPENA